MKRALITGITGQDGSYLAELLHDKGYEIFGIIRRSSSFNTERIEHLYIKELIKDPHKDIKISLFYGDMTDASNLVRIINDVRPDEIYNLAAQSHVRISFDVPEYTANADGIGALRLLEAVRFLGLNETTKIYQASTSELYGKVMEVPQTENTPFYPRSPYGVAKLYGYWITKNYREAYNMHASNGILFNHEIRAAQRKLRIAEDYTVGGENTRGTQDKLYLGNLNAKRDWGYAKDYVDCMWRILQQDEPDDYVIATGETHTVREFAEKAFAEVGIDLKWSGEGIDEKGVDSSTGRVLIEVDPYYFRPTEVDLLIGDSTKAQQKLGWNPRQTSFDELVKRMVRYDLENFDSDQQRSNQLLD